MKLEYHVVDVFTRTPLEGNPLAVFPDASGVAQETMQRIARELNLSETAFVLPHESRDKATRVRIFTPVYEMEFAGHPTIGTAFMLRKLRMVPADAKQFALAENVGDVVIRVDEGEDPLLWLTTPPISPHETFDRASCAAALSLREEDLLPDIPCELLTAGNPNIYVPVRDAATVDRAVINSAAFYKLVSARHDPSCIFVFTPTPAGAYSRMFAQEFGIVEDPATGSATGPLAAYMMKHRLVAPSDGTRFTSEQGTRMGRRSILHVLVHGPYGEAGIEIGGHVTHVASATMEFENGR